MVTHSLCTPSTSHKRVRSWHGGVDAGSYWFRKGKRTTKSPNRNRKSILRKLVCLWLHKFPFVVNAFRWTEPATAVTQSLCMPSTSRTRARSWHGVGGRRHVQHDLYQHYDTKRRKDSLLKLKAFLFQILVWNVLISQENPTLSRRAPNFNFCPISSFQQSKYPKIIFSEVPKTHFLGSAT